MKEGAYDMEEGGGITGVKGGRRNGRVVPLALDQILELLESTVTDQLATSAAALLCRVEGLLLRGMGATGVDAFLVDHWFEKLLRFSRAHETHRTEERQAGGVGAEDDHSLADTGSTADHREKQRGPPEDVAVFDTKAVCSIGEGVAGMAAMTGCKLRIRDCSETQRMRRKRPSFSTDYKSGSLVCWPVRGRTNAPAAAAAPGIGKPPPFVQLQDVDCNAEYDDEAAAAAAVAGIPQDSAGAVLAVLQVHCADGELSAEALEVLHAVGRLLVPLLTDVLDRDQEAVRRRSTEALLSLSSINLRRMNLMEMIEEIVRVAQTLTEAARVCFFLVDDSCEELWVAKAVGYCYGANIKIGEGLCGHAAATGQIVNVIDSYEDSRFDPRFDEQTDSFTRSALCAPIPPPDYAATGFPRRRSPWLKKRRSESVTQGRTCRLEALPQSGGNQQQQQGGVTSPSASSYGGGLQGSTGGVTEWQIQHQQGSSQTHRRPLAVLEVTNKRGRGIFNKNDEEAVWRLCVCVESLLRNKAAEVALLTSGLAERLLVRKSNSAGGVGGAWSNYARVQSTIMRLYSQASFPIDLAMRGRVQRRKNSGTLTTKDGGGGGSGGGIASLRHSLGGSRLSRADLRPVSTHDAEDQRQTERHKGISGRTATVGGKEKSSRSSDLRGASPASTSGVSNGVHRILHRESAREDQELVDLSMSLFNMTKEKLLSLVQRFFNSMGLTDVFKISDRKLKSFTRAVEGRYQLHAFHNFTHAVSVTHVSFMISKTTQAATLLRPLDKLGLLVAAFCHDIDHPGNNNAFEVNSLSPLALLYGDSSVLERHHVFITYQVLLEEGGANDIFSGLTRAQFRDVRQTIVQAILGTDMSGHMEHCAEVFRLAQNTEGVSPTSGRRALSARVARSGMSARISGAFASSTKERERLKSDGAWACGGQSSRAGYGGGGATPPPEHIFSVDNARDRSFLTKTIIHCADLSGQVLEKDLALEWGRRILEEFRLQARLEGNMGLPRTTVASGDLETTTKGQLFFAAKIVKPLWEPFVGLFPSLMPLLDNLNKNCDHYRDEGSRLERQRLSEADAAAAAAAASSDTLLSASKFGPPCRRKTQEGHKPSHKHGNISRSSSSG